MLSLLEQSCEALAGALGEPCAAAVPAADQTSHSCGGRAGSAPSAACTQRFQRITHHLRLGAAGLTRDSLKKGGHFRGDPDVELAHVALYHAL